jgi:3-oxoadipate enol-lactonase
VIDRIEVNGHSLRVRVDGPEGAPWLVLSHSLGAELGLWEPQVAAFGARYRVLRYDTRGHGQSTGPARPWSIADLGGDVVALLDAFGIERANFCGLSLGGATGMWLATHARERIDRLVLCNTTPWLGPPDVMNARISQVLTNGVAPLVEPTLERWFTPEFRALDAAAVDRVRQALLATSAEGYAGCCEALRDMDQRGDLPRISAPTLVIAGTQDPSSTLEAAREWAATIPGALFVELPAAHISNIGAATTFNAAVLLFLAAGTGEQG